MPPIELEPCFATATTSSSLTERDKEMRPLPRSYFRYIDTAMRCRDLFCGAGALCFRFIARRTLRHAVLASACMISIMLFRFHAARIDIALESLGFLAAFFAVCHGGLCYLRNPPYVPVYTTGQYHFTSPRRRLLRV